MHDTAEKIGAAFLQQYSKAGYTIVEIGAYNINGSIRPYAHNDATYIGIDIEEGPGVDKVSLPNDPLPFNAGSVDIVLASSVFEHDSFFWMTFLDLLRITKDGGFIYINAPSNGTYHRHPNDNWRFYPDAGKTLEKWGRLSGHNVHLIESFIAERETVWWNDFVAIFQCGPAIQPSAFLSDQVPCTNVWRLGALAPTKLRNESEDLIIIERQHRQLSDLHAERRRQLDDAPDIVRQKEFIADLRRQFQPTHRAEQRLQELLDKRRGN